MKILKFFIALWLGSAMITFVFMPSVGTYILFLPTMPFTELSTHFSTNSRVQKGLDFRLKNSVIITKEEKLKVAKKICNLEHLDKYKTNGISVNKAKKFCTLDEDYEIYFYKDCGGCNSSSTRTLTTGYVLVRDTEAIESIEIETKETIRTLKDGNKTDYYDRHVPIVELH